MGAPSPTAPRVTLVILTFNEEESLGAMLAETPRDWVHRIIVADGGSTDRTAEIARRHGAEVLVTGRGYGRACLAAAEAPPRTTCWSTSTATGRTTRRRSYAA